MSASTSNGRKDAGAHYRWIALGAAVLCQMCLGATYSWSVFIEPIRDATRATQAQAQYPFSLFYAVFPFMVMLQSFFPLRLKPHVLASAGGVIFGLSWILAGVGIADARWVTLCIGAFGGIGVGAVYLIPLSVVIAWFPNHRGFAAGTVLSAFGGGTALIGTVAERMMHGGGWPVFQTLQTFGIAFALLAGIAGCALRLPESAASTASVSTVARPAISLREIFRNPLFGALFLTMTAGLVTGLTLIANLKHLQGSGLVQGASVVSVFAICNAAGRILWGRMSDRFSATSMLSLNLALTAAIIPVAIVTLEHSAALWLFAAAMGLNYGGVLSMHPAIVARHWGREHLGRVYGLIFAAHFPATLVPPFAGRIWESTGSIAPVLWGCMALCAAAAMALRFSQPGHAAWNDRASGSPGR